MRVRTANSVRFENAEVTIIRGMMVASKMNSVLVALFAVFASSFRVGPRHAYLFLKLCALSLSG
jgi:hypothetical protein